MLVDKQTLPEATLPPLILTDLVQNGCQSLYLVLSWKIKVVAFFHGK